MAFQVDQDADNNIYIVVNRKVGFEFHSCSQSVNVNVLVGDGTGGAYSEVRRKYGEYSGKLINAANVLGCVIKDVKYTQCNCSGWTWMGLTYILLEKDGYTLEIKFKSNAISYSILKLKHNTKCKHTPKLLIHEPNVVEVN